MVAGFEKVSAGSALQAILEETLAQWPDHRAFLLKSFNDRSDEQIKDAHYVAELIGKIAGEKLNEFCASYRVTCGRLREEEINFRRTGAYRFSKNREVADFFSSSEAQYMNQYLRGLLLSQLLWSNHAGTFSFLKNRFMPANASGYRHLEIGPGHGLLVYLAASDEKCSYSEAWDVSQAALDETVGCLEKLGVRERVSLVLKNGTETKNAQAGSFDSVVISEVLEHVEQPVELLRGIADSLAEGGRIFINVPINSPAPDHIFFLKSPEEALELAGSAGLQVKESAFFPMTGFTYERAVKMSATISCVIIASR